MNKEKVPDAKYMYNIRKEITLNHENINITGSGCFCSLSTQIFNIAFSLLIKDEKVIFSKRFVDDHSNSTSKDQNYLGLSSFG